MEINIYYCWFTPKIAQGAWENKKIQLKDLIYIYRFNYKGRIFAELLKVARRNTLSVPPF